MCATDASSAASPYALDLSPAKWIWLPSARTPANTFVLFRRQVRIGPGLRRATGWVSADSRYLLRVNGRRVQWGPAPCDPRFLEADPLDLTALLKQGDNAIGAEVCFFGHGDGTWVAGAPGFAFRLDIEYADGQVQRIVSDNTWQCLPDRAHKVGQYKRWFLRALQEEFDARLHPWGWDEPGYTLDRRWLGAAELAGTADKPPACWHADYATDTQLNPRASQLRRRTIAPIRELEIPARNLAEQGWVTWHRDPQDWFDFQVPGSFDIRKADIATVAQDGWTVPVPPDPQQACFLTFEFEEEASAFVDVTVDAPAGAIVEIIWHEAHDPNGLNSWLDTSYFCWARLVCREGVNRFIRFDYDGFRWVQLHIRNHNRPVHVQRVGMLRRVYDFPATPHVRLAEPALQRLADACLNTMVNNAQGLMQSDASRERQQYSSDGMCQQDLYQLAFGETELVKRFLTTYSQSITKEGALLDAWPGFDRTWRLTAKQFDGADWGAYVLDTCVWFIIDCWNWYMRTADVGALREPYPRLRRFGHYLEGLLGPDGLASVEDLGMPVVWMDHQAYKHQKHKQCAYNLLLAAALGQALPSMARLLGDDAEAEYFERLGRSIHEAVLRRYWDPRRGLFVINKPWLDQEDESRLCDQSLAIALLHDMCPQGRTGPAVEALASRTPEQGYLFRNMLIPGVDGQVMVPGADGQRPELGLSYPGMARWRYEALAKFGRADVILGEMRRLWANQPSVVHNNTLGEDWHQKPDGPGQWSHNTVVPLVAIYRWLAGIAPIEPGFRRVRIRPQLLDLEQLDLTAHTPLGPIEFAARKVTGGHEVRVSLPPGCIGQLETVTGESPRSVELAGGQTTCFQCPGACS